MARQARGERERERERERAGSRRRRSSEESVAIATPGYQLAFWLARANAAHETSRGAKHAWPRY